MTGTRERKGGGEMSCFPLKTARSGRISKGALSVREDQETMKCAIFLDARSWRNTYLVKVLTTPVGSSLSSVSIKDGKEAMTSNSLVVVNEGVCVL